MAMTFFKASILLVCSVFCLNISTAMAQTNVDAERIQQQQQQIIQQQEQRLRDERRQRDSQGDRFFIDLPRPSAKQGDATENALCFDVDTITVSGANSNSVMDIKKITSVYQQRCLALTDINQLLKAITTLYFDRGNVTSRAYLPKQNLSSGTLLIQVVEGVIESFDQTQAPNIHIGTAFPNMLHRILNLRDIEQGIEQLNRLSSNNIRMELVPGEKVGATVIRLINQQQRPWQFNYRYDNSGQSSTGERQNRIYASYDNVLGVNDFFSASLQIDSKNNRQGRQSENVSLRYEAPYGYWLYALDANWFEYLNQVQGQAQLFDTTGESNRQTFTASRVVNRNQSSKTEFISRLTRKSNKNFVEDALLDTSSRTLAIAALQLRHKQYFSGQQSLQTGLTYKRGLDLFGAPEPASSAAPQAEYDAWLLDLSYSNTFSIAKRAWRYSGQVSLQHSDDNLFGSEKISIGSQFTVRGFKEQSLSSRTGGYWRNSLSTYFPLTKKPLSIAGLSPFVGLDIGGVHDDNGLGNDEVISGVSTGLSINSRYFYADLTYAQALKRPSHIDGDKEQFHFSITFDL